MTSGPVFEYQERLVRALMVCESFFLGEDQTADRGHVESVLQERLYPMILEWSNLSFLPPPELLALFDRFAVSGREIDYPRLSQQTRSIWMYFQVTLVDRDGHPLMETVAEELEGLSRTPVRQAVRARALALICPTPKLPGSFTASIPDLRETLKTGTYVDLIYHRTLRAPNWKVHPYELFAPLDENWMAHQLRSWDRKEIQAFLGGRLRRSNLRTEAAGGKIDDAARALTGVLRALIESRAPKLDTVDAILETVRTRPRGDLAEAVLRRVLPLVAVSEVAWAHQELPTGGYADVSTRGTFDRLLISNLAYPDDEFARRMTEGELLYYELEAPPATQPPRQYVLLDGSPSTWGIPRVAGGAVALSVVNRARERRAEATVFAAGRMDRPFLNLDRASGVHELLDHQRWEEDLRGDLKVLADRVLRETKGHPTGADVFLCTEAGRLGEIHDWARSSELPPEVRLHVFASDHSDGRATLWRRDAGAFLPLSTLSLALKDLLPEPASPPVAAAPAPAAVPITSVEVNWDWGSNVTAAALDPSGLALSGHENGEVHLWDSIRAIHLSHRFTVPGAVVSAALSGGYAAVALSKDIPVGRVKSRLLSFAVRKGGFVPVDSGLPPEARVQIQAGWEPGQFFWWSSPWQLVEYSARTFAVRTFDDLEKASYQPFVVDPREKAIFWRDPVGMTLRFDLARKSVAADSPYRSLLRNLVRHRVIDSEGKVTVAMTSGANDGEVQWLDPKGADKPERFDRCQPPKAVSASADRLIAANTDSLWFWRLKERKLIKEIVCPRQKLVGVEWGSAEASQTENALLFTFQGGSGLVLHWYPDETEDGAVQVDPIAVPGMKVYQSSLHGGRGAFRSRSSYPVRPGTGESPLPAGKWRVSCRSDRCAEFFRAGEEEPRLRFWFRATPLLWVAASMEHTAGNALGTLIHPEGTLLLKSPARLARLLATGGPLHA
jgi:hypothetical protein